MARRPNESTNAPPRLITLIAAQGGRGNPVAILDRFAEQTLWASANSASMSLTPQFDEFADN